MYIVRKKLKLGTNKTNLKIVIDFEIMTKLLTNKVLLRALKEARLFIKMRGGGGTKLFVLNFRR